jgi:hypothetical protein
MLAWSFVLAALLGAGCLVPKGGLPGSSQGGAGDGTSTSSSAVGGAGGADPSASATGSASASTGCVPTAEICANGVDDDCDGLTDCADPECSTPTSVVACIASAPPGWTLTTVVPDAAAVCPAGFASAVHVAAAPTSASAACDCSCGAAASNPCTQGQLTIKSGSGCTLETITSTVTGGCDAFGVTLVGPHKSLNASPLKAVSVACAVTVNKPASVPSSVETICGAPASSGGGCAGGQTCFPKVAPGELCIQASGDMACPPGSPFTARQVVGAPGDVIDQRTCGACTCTSSASICSNATLTAYSDGNCVVNPVSAVIDGTCGAAGNNATFQHATHFIYQATPNTTTCTPSTTTPPLLGAFQPSSPITLCCQP